MCILITTKVISDITFLTAEQVCVKISRPSKFILMFSQRKVVGGSQPMNAFD